MKILVVILIVASIVMGYFDGGDMTGALMLTLFLVPAVFGRKEGKQCQEK